jgi:hypothetical protein
MGISVKQAFYPLFLAILALPASANMMQLVTNGSFENTVPTSSFQIDNSNLPGWSISDATINSVACVVFPGTSTTNPCGLPIVFDGGSTSPDGGNFVAIDGGSQYTATLSQTLTGLTMGQVYNVTFYMATSQISGYSGDTTDNWVVSFGSQTQNSTTVINPSQTTTGWISQSLNFTADNTSDVLSFLAAGTPNSEPPMLFLDGVSVLGQSSAPEPGTYALMIFGLAGIFVAARRMKKRTQ